MKSIKRIILVLFCLQGLVYSQPVEEWTNFNTNLVPDWHVPEVRFTDMASDSIGNVYIVFYDSLSGNYRQVTSKYDSNGNIIWTIPSSITKPWIHTTRILMGKNGNIYVAYMNDADCVIKMIDSNGNTQWQNSGGWGNYPISLSVDTKQALILETTTLYSTYYRTVKYNRLGVQQWIALYNGGANYSFGYSVATDLKNNIYVTGSCLDTGIYYNMVTVKYNESGIRQWVSRYNKFHNVGKLISVDTKGYPVVTGWRSPNQQSPFDFISIKYDHQNGKEIWNNLYSNGGNNIPYAMIIDDQNYIYVTGLQVGYSSVTMKYHPNGNREWIRIHPGAIGYSIALDIEKSVYITGGSSVFHPQIQSDIVTTKYDRNGYEAWSVSYSNGIRDIAYNIGIDQNWRIYVSGLTYNGSTGAYDGIIIKYDQSSARPLLLMSNINVEIPNEFMLHQNYPNPFNPVTKIKFSLPAGSVRYVSLKVFDINGREVATLVDRQLMPGIHEAELSGSTLASGTYFYRLRAGEFTDIKKMILIK